jgi:hypothetical protein
MRVVLRRTAAVRRGVLQTLCVLYCAGAGLTPSPGLEYPIEVVAVGAPDSTAWRRVRAPDVVRSPARTTRARMQVLQ